MLKIDSLTKSFGDKKVLDRLSFSCDSVGITAVMGASGIGKTTLLNIIAGLDRAYEGEVVSTFKKVAYKFQEPRLFDWLSAVENVKLVCGDGDADRKARHWLEAVGLSDSLGKYPRELSGGMQQRVALARALAYEGDLLLLDEPFSAVDRETKERLIDLVKEYGKTHAVILVTHDEQEAAALGATLINIH